MKFFTTTVTLILVILTLLNMPQQGISASIGDAKMTVEPDDLLYKLKKSLDVAGFNKMQRALDLDFKVHVNSTYKGDYLRKIVSLIDDQVGITNPSGRPVGLLDDVQHEIESTFLNFPTETELPDCTDLSGMFYGKVDYTKMCQLVPTEADKHTDTTYAARQVMHALMNKYRMTNVKGQMFIGMTNDIIYLYPALRLSDNEPGSRFRPWYGTTLTPPKYIILAIDVSFTMHAFFNIAKEIAQIFIHSSNPLDRITVLGYAAAHVITPRKMEPCFDNYTLAEATPVNQAKLKKFIDELTISGSAQFEVVLDKIFSFINHPSDRDRFVIFIASGVSVEPTNVVLKSIRSRRTPVSKDVKFVTIDLGNPSNILKRIGDEFGKYISPEDVVEPYDNFKIFVRYLAYKPPSKLLSPPFYDTITQEVISTLSKPIFVEDKLVAVVAVEVNMQKIFLEFNSLVSDTKSYMFIIDKFGLIHFHPRVPRLDHLVPIDVVEKEAQEIGVISRMLRGGSGQVDLMIEDTLSIGRQRLLGLQTKFVKATFTWQPIHASNMMGSRYRIHPLFTARPFVYHDILFNKDIKKCEYFHHAVTKDSTVVKFSGAAFINASKYLNEVESEDKKRLYAAIVKGDSETQQFKAGVVESVSITSVVETDWVRNGSFLIWKVLATETGVTRIYPGKSEEKQYTPVMKSWYVRSTSRPTDIIVSSPHLDQWVGGFVITLSKALTMRKLPDLESRVPFGALKVEVFVEYLYTALFGGYPGCKSDNTRCFLVDETGYIVVHPDFMKPPSSPTSIPKVEQIHIVEKECTIAERLVRLGIMTRVTCFEQNSFALFHSYKMKAGVTISEQNPLSEQIGAEVYHLPNTNVYAIIKLHQAEADEFEIGVCHCPHSYLRVMPECKRDPRTICSCPCLYSGTNDTCSKRNASICPPLDENVFMYELMTSEETVLLAHLQACDVPDCRSRETRTTCHQLVECHWCSVRADGSALQLNSFCGRRQECYFGMVGHQGIFNDGTPEIEEKAWEFFAVMSIVMFSSIVVVMVAVLGLIWKIRNRRESVTSVRSDTFNLGSRHNLRRQSTDISEAGTIGFYGPFSHKVFDDIHSVQEAPKRRTPSSLRTHKSLSGASRRTSKNSLYTTRHWSRHRIRKMNSAFAVLEQQRRAHNALNVTPGLYSRRRYSLPNDGGVAYMPEYRKHMNTVIEELSKSVLKQKATTDVTNDTSAGNKTSPTAVHKAPIKKKKGKKSM